MSIDSFSWPKLITMITTLTNITQLFFCMSSIKLGKYKGILIHCFQLHDLKGWFKGGKKIEKGTLFIIALKRV